MKLTDNNYNNNYNNYNNRIFKVPSMRDNREAGENPARETTVSRYNSLMCHWGTAWEGWEEDKL
jgi:hypothetical protein